MFTYIDIYVYNSLMLNRKEKNMTISEKLENIKTNPFITEQERKERIAALYEYIHNNADAIREKGKVAK